MHKKILTLVLTVLFALQVPATAGAFSYHVAGYTPPPVSELTTLEKIMEDANNFIEAFYDLQNYFEPITDIYHNFQKDVPLRVDKEYNISDVSEEHGTIAPILYYEKPGGGPGRNQQYLGQTKDGYTITNVRFPLNASWSFLEDLEWALARDEDAFLWWQNQMKNSLPEPNKLIFNNKANENPNYAKILDFCIGVGTIGQLRNWGGQQYYISKAQAGVDGNPGKPGQAINYNYKLTTEFPWHKYVNILMPPTWNTYGYGIGFYKWGGSYSYKSFPILPLKHAFIPDFVPKTDKTIYTGQPGDTVTVNVTLWNEGEHDITNFAWTEYGGGWGNPKWLDTDVELGDGESKNYTVDFVVTDQPQKYVFAANVYGDKPVYELNKANNSLVIIVAPDGVDLAASIAPTQKTYRARSFPYMTACNVSGIRLDNGEFEVPAVINVTLSDGQNRVFNHTFKAGGKWGQPAIWDIKKPGTYTARVEIQPIGYKDTNPANNVATCTFTIVAQEITPPKNTGDEDITGGLGSL